MVITVHLFPPFKYPDGNEERRIEVKEGLNIGTLLRNLEKEGALQNLSHETAFALVANQPVQDDYILKDGENIKILLRPNGG